MPTERQSESARINGAKSHGPKSAEGKKKSSRNSLRHGCTASHTLILACEDPKDFKRMVQKYETMHKPVTLEEQDLVAEMISARWRIRRATGIESSLLDCELADESGECDVRADDRESRVGELHGARAGGSGGRFAGDQSGVERGAVPGVDEGVCGARLRRAVVD